MLRNLVGTWHYVESHGNATAIHNDLTFTITPNGSYVSRITIPDAHAISGAAEVKNGFLVIIITNRDNASLPAPIMSRETIIRLEKEKLATRSEGSTVENVFRKDGA